jgi:hypothetical protein
MAIPLWPSPSSAETRVFSRAGGWQAWGGTANDGTKVCGVSAQGGGRWIGIKYFENEKHLTIQLSKDNWKFKNGAEIDVSMRIDSESPWTATATGFHMSDGDGAVEFHVGIKNLARWMQEFRDGEEMIIDFPDTSADGWRVDLRGTNDISNDFGRCLNAIM